MSTSSLTVTFSAPDGAEDDFALSLDEEKIREVYNEDNKTRFAPGEAAYLKLIHSSGVEYEMFSSAGSINRAASRVPYAVSENIVFALSRFGTLRHFPRKDVAWQWIGKSAGTPLFNGRSIRIEEPSVAVLKCEYETDGDRLKLVITNSDMGGHDVVEVAVIAVQGKNKVSATVTYDTGEGGEPVPINLLVKDFCSDVNVPEVEVFLDGVSVGVTNGNGKIYLGMLAPGGIHQLKMTCAGYIDSDLDVLHNDSFTVPTPTS